MDDRVPYLYMYISRVTRIRVLLLVLLLLLLHDAITTYCSATAPDRTRSDIINDNDDDSNNNNILWAISLRRPDGFSVFRFIYDVNPIFFDSKTIYVACYIIL
jgi:hypothetical protein